MATGGTWTTQNKIRPGAYLNLNVAPSTSIVTGVRGIVAAAIPLSWGPEGEIIRVTADDFLAGRTASQLGFTFSDESGLPVRLLLRGAQTALIYRLDTGGQTASTTWSYDDGTDSARVGTAIVGSAKVGNDGSVSPFAIVEAYTVTAKYPGTAGNNIIVSIQERASRPGDFEVSVVFNGVRREYGIVRTLDELANFDSDFVTITPSDTLTEIVSASGIVVGETVEGTNGTIDTSDLSGFFTALDYQYFNTVCVYSEEPDFNNILVDQVRDWSQGQGKYCKCVVLAETNTFDYEGVTIVNDGYLVGDEYEVTPGLFVLLVAGLDAGMAYNQDLTSFEIPEATEIITPKSHTQIENAILDGILVLSYRQDGAIVIEDDINSKVTLTNDNEYALQRNQVVRTVYYILNSVALIFNRNFSGKVPNNAAGRAAFQASINNLLLELENEEAIRDLRPAEDIRVSQGDRITDVYVEIDIWPVSVMIKLYGIVTIYLTERA